MVGKNKGICWGCGKSGHFLLDCRIKRPCLVCGKGIEKSMDVENLGWLFFCCTNDCSYFKWLNEDKLCQFQVESSAMSNELELSSLLKNVAKIAREKDVDISVKFTFLKGKGETHNV